ncbi:MAG: hypothetical protein ACREV5_20625 [Steroidobacter sp.]
MDLSYLMLTGSLSGLISLLAHSVVWSGVELIRGPARASALAHSAIAVSEALLHMLCGISLGLLFWLSWGLAAVVDVSWWVRGLSFGSLCWFALTLPTLLDLAFAKRVPSNAAALAASRWATTCLITSLACAWGWERAL